MPVTTCVFDAYGTLFDVAAAARLAAEQPEFPALAKAWPQLAEHWRAKQLNYSWLRAVMGTHTDFWTVTQDALDWSLAKTGRRSGPAPALAGSVLGIAGLRRGSRHAEDPERRRFEHGDSV